MRFSASVLLLGVLLVQNASAKFTLLGTEEERIDGHYIIGFHTDEASTKHFQHVKDNWKNYFDDEPLQLGRALGLNMLHARLSDEELARAETLSGVDYIHHDMIVKHAQQGSISPTQPGLDVLDGTQDGTFNYLNDGSGVVINVIDTGCDCGHAGFRDGQCTFLGDCVGARTENNCATNQNQDPGDPQGHGTHVAGIAASPNFGVATGADVICTRVLGDNGSGSTSGIVSGLNLAVEEAQREMDATGRPTVINMSLGGGRNRASNDAASAAGQSVVVVVAAGNDGVDAANTSPASANNVITVGSTEASGTVSSFSNTGSVVEVFATGSQVRSLRANTDGTVVYSGTSMASPTIAGVAAMVLAADTSRTPAEVSNIIQTTSVASVSRGRGNVANGTPNRFAQINNPDFFSPGGNGGGNNPVEDNPMTEADSPVQENTPVDSDNCLSTVDEFEALGNFNNGQRTRGFMFDAQCNENAPTGAVLESVTVFSTNQITDGRAAVFFVTDRGNFTDGNNRRDPNNWTAVGGQAIAVNSNRQVNINGVNLFENVLTLPEPHPFQAARRQGLYATFLDNNAMVFDNRPNGELDRLENLAEEPPIQIFPGRATFRQLFGRGRELIFPLVQLCYSDEDPANDAPQADEAESVAVAPQQVPDNQELECLESSNEDESLFNRGTGIMFDLTVDGLEVADREGVFLESFDAWIHDELETATAEVWTTINGQSYLGQENDRTLWTRIAVRDGMQWALDGAWIDDDNNDDLGSIDGPEPDEMEQEQIIDVMETERAPELFSFNFDMNYELRRDGTPQGFYLTFTEEQMRYYDADLPESSVITSNGFVTMTGGKGVAYPFMAGDEPRQFAGTACFGFEARSSSDSAADIAVPALMLSTVVALVVVALSN